MMIVLVHMCIYVEYCNYYTISRRARNFGNNEYSDTDSRISGRALTRLCLLILIHARGRFIKSFNQGQNVIGTISSFARHGKNDCLRGLIHEKNLH